MRLLYGLAAVLGSVLLPAQQQQPSTVAAPPQLSPDAAYQQALHPLDVVRRSMDNWSESELNAFTLAIKSAKAACAARTPTQFSGEDLVAYARLCSLGQDWATMGVAAAMYIDSKLLPKPQLATAYGFKVESKLHAHDVPGTLAVEKSMLQSVPYGDTVDTVTNEALAYLQLTHTDDALALHGMREPLLLAQLRSDKPAVAKSALYADGLAKAALEQYAGRQKSAEQTVRELDEALLEGAGSSLQADDAVPIESVRRQYALLGKPLPPIHLELSLKDVKEKPHTVPGATTAYLLFPDWCAQCIRMAPDLWDAIGRLKDYEGHLYGLVAETMPDKAALLVEQNKPMGPNLATLPIKPGATPVSPKAPTPSQLLLHTPTLVVPPETLRTFAATDFPFLIVVDHAGIVRFAAPAPESVLQPGGFLDEVASHVNDQWPVPKAPKASR